jgi:hypothetical protein
MFLLCDDRCGDGNGVGGGGSDDDDTDDRNLIQKLQSLFQKIQNFASNKQAGCQRKLRKNSML